MGQLWSMYYEVGQVLLPSGTAFCITKWDKWHYKVEQVLHNGTNGISNWGKYYKVGLLLLQSWATITKGRKQMRETWEDKKFKSDY